MCDSLTRDDRDNICRTMHSMDVLYNQTLRQLDKSFRRLEAMVPTPQMMRHGDSFVFRYKEKTIQQALIQKLARMVSGLHAARLLCDNGMIQEQAAIQRMLDEFHEDIWFLAFAIVNKDGTPLHQECLDAFYKEEFDPATGVSTLDRPMVPRRKIRAYLARLEQQPYDPSSAIALYHTIHSAYSGYVHGSSPHIMDMFGGNPPQFHINGMTGTPRHETHRYDLFNPFLRAILSFAIGAKAFGDEKLSATLSAFYMEFDRQSGRNETHQNASSAQARGSLDDGTAL